MITEPIKFYKTVVNLPQVLEPNTMYAVRVGEGFDFYLSDLTGSIAYQSNSRESDKTVTLFQDGLLEPTTGTVRWYNPRIVNINKITARLSEAADDTVSVLVKKSGVTVHTINFPASSVKQEATVNIAMVVDDYLTVDIVTVGNVSRGRGLSVEFTYRF